MTKSEYLGKLKSAVEWALSSDRTAWKRTVSVIESGDKYGVEALVLLRNEILLGVDHELEAWFDPIYEKATGDSPLFDLGLSPEQIWDQMIYMNSGVFDERVNGTPLTSLLRVIPSLNPGEGPLYLSLNEDGWGVTSNEEHS